MSLVWIKLQSMHTDKIYDFYIPEYMDAGIGSHPNKLLHIYYLDQLISFASNGIMEIGIGSGALTTLFLEKAVQVTAIDISKECIEYVMKKSKQLGLSNNLLPHQVDILTFEPTKRFSCVVASDDFLVHLLSKKDLNIFFSKINDLLEADGFFMSDLRNIEHDEYDIPNCYPVHELFINSSVSYIRCTSWLSRIENSAIRHVNYHYEEIDSQGKVQRSFIKILQQLNLPLNDIKEAAFNNGLEMLVSQPSFFDGMILTFKKQKQ